MAEYQNSFWRPSMEKGTKAISCNKEPEEYKGFLIYERTKGICYDIVKDGICIGMYAGIGGAKQRIDSGRLCMKHYSGEEGELGTLDCQNTVCDSCVNDEKNCAVCGGKIVAGEQRTYDSGAPFHDACYEREYGAIN